MFALGFNTIDAMMWNFYYHDWIVFAPNVWAFTPTLYIDVWLAYFLFGITPLVVGSFILGFVINRNLK